MASHDDTLALADRYRQAGCLADAEQLYEQLVGIAPNEPVLWHRLGSIAHQQGRLELAVERLHKALALQPEFAEAWSDLGTVFQVQGKLDEAVECLRTAIDVQPRASVLHFNLGNTLKLQGKYDEAISNYCRAVEISPDFAEAYFNLGVVCREIGLIKEAIRHYRQAIRLQPQLAAAHTNLGDALQDSGKHEEAVACYQATLAITPEDAAAYNNMGNAFRAQEKFQQALACYGRALERNPQYAEAHSNLGTVFQKLGKLPEAFTCYQTALQINPQLAQAYTNLGTALQEDGQLNEAYACQCRAIELNPQDIEAHVNRAMLLLLAGDFERGWEEYEWRWRLPGMSPPTSKRPKWNGESLAGRVILVHAEQGLGDTFQFVRYVSGLKRQGATVLFSCPPSLHPILRSCPGIDRLVSETEKPPIHDYQVALLSLPRILKTSLNNVPAGGPYLCADASLVTKWGGRLGDRTSFRIGIHWQGRAGTGAYRKRDIPLEQFGRLAGLGVQLVSLQKLTGLELQLASMGIFDPGNDLDSQAGAFMDSAAIMANVDLVISSDTSVPHLAGALGLPVWLALPVVPDWRWLLDRPDSPWYPTMRLFRQVEIGNWNSVFNDIEVELRQTLSAGTN